MRRTQMLNIDEFFKGCNFDWEIIILCVRGYLILHRFYNLTTNLAAGVSHSVEINIKLAVQEVIVQGLCRRLGQNRRALDRTVVYNNANLDGAILADACGSVEIRLRHRAGQPRICDGPSQLFRLCVVGSRKSSGACARRRRRFFAALQIGFQVYYFSARRPV